MAVALEVGWGSDELGLSRIASKKRAWGDDHQKLLEMMMGKSLDDSNGSSPAAVGGKHTLDLLGSSSSSSSITVEEQSDFLELGEELPLPIGWEKRLDLKSGTVFFINLNTGKSTRDDPRQSQSSCHFSLELLQSKQQLSIDQETLKTKRHKTNSSSNKSWPELENEPANFQSCSNTSSLDLKLNLSTSEPESQLDPPPHWLLSSLSKSCSSDISNAPVSFSSPETSNKVTLTCCKRCLMYVMISQSDPRCPKCASSVVIDFPMPKKPRINLEL